MKPTRPEKLSDIVRRVWVVLAIVCAAYALACVLRSDSIGALVVSLSGLCFWWLSRIPYDDLDR